MLYKSGLLALFAFSVFTFPAHAKPQTALAMTGEPLYPPAFTHFSYANPQAPKGGTLKLGATGTFDSLNPFIVRGQPPLGLATGTMPLVYERLMNYGWDEPFTLYGELAESVEVGDDRSSIIFYLNKAARFSDGKPVTADDVLFSFETLRDKGRPNHRTYYKKVASAEKLSPLSVKFTFKRDEKGAINRELPLIIGLLAVLPKHDWQDRDFNETTLRIPIGSGPYKISSVDVGRSITYERNPLYWAKDLPVKRGLFNFDKIRVDYYRDDGVSLQAFKAGLYDMRREADPAKAAAAYDFPAAREKRVRLERLEHHRTEPAYGYILNTRRALFADPVLRAAMQYTLDFGWINRNFFYGQYKRVDSFYPNSELVAPPKPEGKELRLLTAFRDKLPADIFNEPVTPPDARSADQFRADLLKAEAMLRDKGYALKNNRLFSPHGEAVAFEILLGDPSEEKTALNWAASLERLGIAARIHTVDSAQYQSRLASFDFDVTANKWVSSLSPGNEQMYYFGSPAADQKGSRNYAGIKDPVVDALAQAITNAASREELVAAAHALDRVLMRGHYFVPLYYQSADTIASWTRIQRPARLSLHGNILESWWSASEGR